MSQYLEHGRSLSMVDQQKIEEAWKQFATEIGADFYRRSQATGRYESEMVVAQVKREHPRYNATFQLWTIVLDTRRAELGRVPMGATDYATRMTASFISKDGFRFAVSGSRQPSWRRWLSREQGIELGYPDLDRRFSITGTDKSKVRALFADAKIRDLVQSESLASFKVNRPADQPKEFLQLYFNADGVITNVERLKALHELFVRSLNQLVRIGSASYPLGSLAGRYQATADSFRQRGLDGDFERAVADYDDAIWLDPDCTRAYYGRGLAYAELRKMPEATADLEKAKQLTEDAELIVELDEHLARLRRKA